MQQTVKKAALSRGRGKIVLSSNPMEVVNFDNILHGKTESGKNFQKSHFWRFGQDSHICSFLMQITKHHYLKDFFRFCFSI